jgi:hypothetical protein
MEPQNPLEVEKAIRIRYNSSIANPSLYIEDTNATGGRTWSINVGEGAAGRFSIRDVTAGASRILIDENGNVGIGTVSPTATLHLYNATGNLSIIMSGGSFGNDFHKICTRPNGDHGACWETGAGYSARFYSFNQFDPWFWVNWDGTTEDTVAKIDNAGNMLLQGTLTQSGNPDIAENIRVSDLNISAGDIVMIDPKNNEAVIKADTPYSPYVIGVISTNPGLLLNAPESSIETGKTFRENERPLVLAGRVFVKVSNINGPINVGDPITSSIIPGVGMKAKNSGVIVGRALEQFNPEKDIGKIIECPKGTGKNVKCGKIIVFVNVGWMEPLDTEEIKELKTEIEKLKKYISNLENKI